MLEGALGQREGGARLVVGDQQHLGDPLEQRELLGRRLVGPSQRGRRLGRTLIAHQELGVLLVVERRLGSQAVERMQVREPLEHLRRRESEPHHLLADGDRVLVEAALLVRVRGREIAIDRARVVAALVQEIGEEDEVVWVAIGELDELLVLTERAVHITALDRALRSSFDLECLVQVG
ncbi:MAG: hypothetical protein E6K80_05805 [Candidatus Eisenbacteria bacterium]|uniref:Uncharacterized protein n=1 Tax=Eiseniibacteriota bacterium TaxID=2212470 RepID=A0A538U666_UNCEI|nr:MAG: hypothetical protein E6K80_05805 [Candidatus Eisenbacteria bacterium]